MEMAAFGEPHVWTTTNGNRFPGEYYSAGQNQVVVTIKISDLSDADRSYIASQKAAAQASASKIQSIRILSLPDIYGFCTTSVGQIYLDGLPQSVTDFTAKYYRLKSTILAAEVNAEQLRRDAARADANAVTGASGDAGYVNAAMVPRFKAENMRVDAENAAHDLASMKSQLAEMEPVLIQNTTVLAYFSGRQYSGLPVWQCVGMALPAQTSQ